MGCLVCLFPLSGLGQSSGLLLPDLTPELLGLLGDEIEVSEYAPEFPGQGLRVLRYGTLVGNRGAGILHVFQDDDTIDLTSGSENQPVSQRIYRADGSFVDRSAGEVEFHPEHGHVHVTDWATARIRELLPDGSAGAVISESSKTSSCILNTDLVDADLYANAALRILDLETSYRECGSHQLLDSGWGDFYSKDIIGQAIPLTDDLSGQRVIFELIIDPLDRILESDETNNTLQVEFQIPQFAQVPEPSVAMLIGLVGLCLIVLRRRYFC